MFVLKMIKKIKSWSIPKYVLVKASLIYVCHKDDQKNCEYMQVCVSQGFTRTYALKPCKTTIGVNFRQLYLPVLSLPH